MFNPALEVLYAQAIDRGRRGQLWSALTGRSRALLELQQTGASADQAPAAGGMSTVPIRQIRGSESRAGDFDRDFNPLQSHTRLRWLGIAAARQRGRRLPPVALIQVDNLYFVRDGHHRISVARALGYATVEATVQVWQVAGPAACEKPAPAVTRRSGFQAVVSSFARRLMLQRELRVST